MYGKWKRLGSIAALLAMVAMATMTLACLPSDETVTRVGVTGADIQSRPAFDGSAETDGDAGGTGPIPPDGQ